MPFLHYKYLQGYSENPLVFIGFIWKSNGENATNFMINFRYCNPMMQFTRVTESLQYKKIYSSMSDFNSF